MGEYQLIEQELGGKQNVTTGNKNRDTLGIWTRVGRGKERQTEGSHGYLSRYHLISLKEDNSSSKMPMNHMKRFCFLPLSRP